MTFMNMTDSEILFNDGTVIEIAPPEWKMELDEAEHDKLIHADFKYLAFTERPGGFAFGDILNTMVTVKIVKTTPGNLCTVFCNGETKIDLEIG